MWWVGVTCPTSICSPPRLVLGRSACPGEVEDRQSQHGRQSGLSWPCSLLSDYWLPGRGSTSWGTGSWRGAHFCKRNSLKLWRSSPIFNSQCERELNPRPEGLVLQPVRSLHHREMSGEEDGGPLSHSHRGGDLAVVGMWGEAGSKRCQDRETAEDVAAAPGPTFRIFCEVFRLLSDK